MKLYIVPGDGLPIYLQILRQIKGAIAGGGMGPGDRLPSHRDLAAELVISPLTVKKAYDELEAQGYVRTERGRGTFVAERLTRLSEEEKIERVRPAARSLVSEVELTGLPFGKLVNLLWEERRRLR